MRTTLLLLAMSLLLGACGGSDDSNTGYQGATSSGTFFVKVATSPAPIPLNETFSADVAVYDSHDQTLMLDDVDVVLDGEMPQHGHGMSVQPTASKNSDGSVHVDGMLFHMPGTWKLHVDVTRQNETERATFDVVLEP